MQENNNFEAIISKWRRLSVIEKVERQKIVEFASMAGDSSNHQPFLKDNESDLLVPEHSGHLPLAAASTGLGAVSSSELPPEIVSVSPEEKQEFIKKDQDDSKEAAGNTDADKKGEDRDHLNGDSDKDKSQNETVKDNDLKSEKDKLGDNVDSVFLRSPPPHKARSTASTPEEEDCGIKCLYYTLQCCDCILM